jgi:hypothetical protein
MMMIRIGRLNSLFEPFARAALEVSARDGNIEQKFRKRSEC